jgi:hypothetical protein
MMCVDIASLASAASTGVKATAEASSGDINWPRRPVRIWTMLIADEVESHVASSNVGAQMTETAIMA